MQFTEEEKRAVAEFRLEQKQLEQKQFGGGIRRYRIDDGACVSPGERGENRYLGRHVAGELVYLDEVTDWLRKRADTFDRGPAPTILRSAAYDLEMQGGE